MENLHFIAFGKPGSGKSTYLKNRALDDVEAGDRAVIYLDPHGEDARDLLEAIPKNRIRDTIYLDASDGDYAVGFEPLDAPHRLVSALKTIFKDSWGPRLEQGLRNGVAAIVEARLTLHDLCPMFYDERHRMRVLAKVAKSSTRTYWLDLFPRAYNERQQQEAASPIYNKIDAILASDIHRHLTQKSPKLDFRDVIENRKICVVNLATPSIGDDGALVLGSLFTTAFRNNLMSHPGPASFFADEFQIYGTDVYLSMLRELRKFGLKLGLATQTAQGIDPAFLSVILGTVRDVVVFNVSFDDAKVLAAPMNTIMQDFTSDLANLPPFTAFVDDQRTELSPFRSPRRSRDKIIAKSRQLYARRRIVPPPARRQAPTPSKPSSGLTAARWRRRI